MKFLLRDNNAAVVQAWLDCFSEAADVSVSVGDIFEEPTDAIVSPANSFGFMDGGIDLAYSLRFGWGLEERLQALLRAEHDGELPVGQAVIVDTGDARFPLMVSAPTMRVPMDVSETVNAYLAFRAVIRTVRAHNQSAARRIETVLCPGLGTAVGRMHPKVCARQMYHAYETSHLGRVTTPPDLLSVSKHQFRMTGRAGAIL
jgi:O-acetyl-ADP-ribose deacetylase (regulator of RNase III)